jgi:malonate-semialdehyde dehydrogenase (acetylating)/methylmalonate-semialdehyde dehydrogenase
MRTVSHWIDGATSDGESTRAAAIWDPATGAQQA